MIAVTAATAVALTGCVNPFPGIQFTPEGTSTPTGQANAPYPADLDHLDDILALGKTTLPEGASNITVSPALKTAEASPGAWGYVIAYRAEPQPIRDHVEKYTGHAGKYVDVFLILDRFHTSRILILILLNIRGSLGLKMRSLLLSALLGGVGLLSVVDSANPHPSAWNG